jgi:hypothetical protein
MLRMDAVATGRPDALRGEIHTQVGWPTVWRSGSCYGEGRGGGDGLAYYRLYTLDRAGRISDVRIWEGEDDAAALAWAAGQGHVHGQELWNLDRLVRRFSPEPQAPPAPKRGA